MGFGETVKHDQHEAKNPFSQSRTSTLLIRTARVEIHRGGIALGDGPRWGEEQYHGSFPCVSFPMAPVLVEKEGMSPFIGAVNRASFFNQGQHYRVTRVGPPTTSSFRLNFDPDLIIESFKGSAGWTGDGARPFAVGSMIIGNETYLAHRRLEAGLNASPDPVLIEESALRILDLVFEVLGTPAAPHSGSLRTRRAHEEAVRAAEQCMSTRFDERLTLATVARSACVAPAHLCRIYRACTGISVHEYLTRQRIRRGVDLLLTTRMDTAEIAVRCGFSSRSHFSDSLARLTGTRPGAIRFRHGAMRTRMRTRF